MLAALVLFVLMKMILLSCWQNSSLVHVKCGFHQQCFFFPSLLFLQPSLCSDSFTGQPPGKRGTRRAKVQGLCRCLREWRKSTGRGWVGRSFGQDLAPVGMIGFNVVKIWGGFAEKGGSKGGHGVGGLACSESGCNALLEDGGCLSRFGSC